MQPKVFFDYLRAQPLFAPKLVQGEVDGINNILGASANTPISFLAYMLATTYWETKHTMQPIDEDGGASYFFRRYDPQGARPDIAHELGNTQPGDGALFHGRGLVQVTGRGNYSRIGKLIGADLVGKPDLAKDPKVAARILHDGMTFGWFTGRRLGQYLPANGTASTALFVPARYIINGQDHAGDIAKIATEFQEGLIKAGW